MGAIQRCQYHKRQKVKGRLPKKCIGSWIRPLCLLVRGTQTGRRICVGMVNGRAILYRLIKTLKDAYPGAARSLEEGLDETLTVVDLGLPKALRQSLQTTNLIESAFPACIEGRQVGRAAGYPDGEAVAQREYG
ncbi:hypothetical protein IBX73_10800 [candidate division WOR-3 bacterium]|nr:hypothetical protein [candidate division WOR-3 bacterium]